MPTPGSTTGHNQPSNLPYPQTSQYNPAGSGFGGYPQQQQQQQQQGYPSQGQGGFTGYPQSSYPNSTYPNSTYTPYPNQQYPPTSTGRFTSPLIKQCSP